MDPNFLENKQNKIKIRCEEGMGSVEFCALLFEGFYVPQHLQMRRRCSRNITTSETEFFLSCQKGGPVEIQPRIGSTPGVPWGRKNRCPKKISKVFPDQLPPPRLKAAGGGAPFTPRGGGSPALKFYLIRIVSRQNDDANRPLRW